MIVACLQCGHWYRFPDDTGFVALDLLLPSTKCKKAPITDRVQTIAHKWAIMKGSR